MTSMKVADFTPEQLKELVRESVAEALADLLKDPDVGLELREDLLDYLKRTKPHGEGVPVEDVVKGLGLNW